MLQVFTRSDTGSIDIRYADETIAAVWADSAAAKAELPDHPPLVRKAVRALLSSCLGEGSSILDLPGVQNCASLLVIGHFW